MSILLSSCGIIDKLKGPVQVQGGCDPQTCKILEELIDELGNQPARWGETLENATEKLGSVTEDLANVIKEDLEELLTHARQEAELYTVGTLGELAGVSFCAYGYFGERLKGEVEEIAHNRFPDYFPAPVLVPVICTSKPPDRIIAGTDEQITYYGYNFLSFQRDKYSVDLIYGDNGSLVSGGENFGALFEVSDYKIQVTFQGPQHREAILALDADRQPGLRLVWNNEPVMNWSEETQRTSSLTSVLPIIIPTLAPPSPEPPKTAHIDVQIFCNVGNISGTPFASITAPANYKVIGGGAVDQFTGDGNLLTQSYPQNLTSWYAMGKDHLLSDTTGRIKVCAMAIHDPVNLWDIRIFSETSRMDENWPSQVVEVDDGYTLVGGGAKVTYSGVGSMLFASFPSSLSAWQADSKDHIDPDKTRITTYAIGIKSNDAAILFPQTFLFNRKSGVNSGKVRMSIQTSEITSCPSNTTPIMLSGGARIEQAGGPGMLLTASYPDGLSRWYVEGKDHKDPSRGAIEAFMIYICNPPGSP